LADANRPQSSPYRAALIVSSGNLLEMYDFTVYGYYAGAIARTYFPTADPYASTMATFGVFGAGFLMRPLGAVALGAVVDRFGRRNGLLLTLALMAVGTLTIALTPGYARIGLAAPLMVLLGRLVQGLSAGVELGGVSVYLAEIAPPGRKGFLVSWQSASQQVAVMAAAGIGVAASGFLNQAQMQAWGWRIPFLIGCAVIPFLILMRRRLEETPAFLARSERPTALGVVGRLGQGGFTVAAGALMVILTTVAFYTITAYTPTFGTGVLHLSLRDAFVVTLCVGLSNFLLLPAAGATSDRIGRLPLLVGAAALALFTAYPMLRWLVAAPSFGRLLTVELWLSAVYAVYNGAMVVFLTEVMPPAARTSGFSLAYSLAAGVFGGFTPAICTWLIHRTGDNAMPGAWLAAAAALSLVGVGALSWLGRLPTPAAAPTGLRQTEHPEAHGYELRDPDL
jgi:MFS family permease